ncbi:ABC transporter permease [Frigoriglobus tundricola]|uniref:Alkanesulfonates transport system permease protein n=1 Tax=Frigoriglobus tundricola TaxID=2774151 RepID=A0A6M5Z3K8_9BACT|nr:ABC transporter permease subunit [Frigoriglobus tundricola]QJX01010.1 Alkanesulfonates transport system permease protein [Frigoriglobus tundricola]
MTSKLADPHAPVAAPVAHRRGAGPARTIVPVLSPVFVAAIALALHYGVSDAQLPPLTWLGALPAWQHPYPVGLVLVAGAGLLVAAGQAALPALRPTVRHVAPLVAGAIGVTAVWELVTTKMDWLHKPFFPGPDEVFGAIVEDRVLLLECAWHSLRLLLSGYLTGVAAGLITGTVIGWFPRVRYWAMPAIKFVGPVPATALIHVAMSIWKDSFPAAVALIAFAVWFPMTILTSSGIANVRLSYLDVARTLGAGRFYLIFRVALPAALPTIFIGLFMGLGASFLTLIVAENAGVTAGLGWYLSWQKGYMEYAKMYGVLVLSGVFFSTLMSLLFMVRDRVLKWQKGVIKW